MAAITLNGTTFYASSIDEDVVKVGTVNVSANGTRTWVQRGHKRTWEITWELVTGTVRSSVRTIFLLTSTFTFVNEDSASYTVQCEAEDYSSSVSAIASDGTPYYDVTLTVREA